MISPLSSIFTSKSKAQEIILLLHDAKEVLRQGFYQKELPAVEKFCHENNLYLVKSKFKVILYDENQFTNKGVRIPDQDQRQGMYFIYISKQYFYQCVQRERISKNCAPSWNYWIIYQSWQKRFDF